MNPIVGCADFTFPFAFRVWAFHEDLIDLESVGEVGPPGDMFVCPLFKPTFASRDRTKKPLFRVEEKQAIGLDDRFSVVVAAVALRVGAVQLGGWDTLVKNDTSVL